MPKVVVDWLSVLFRHHQCASVCGMNHGEESPWDVSRGMRVGRYHFALVC
jgi:hypothetical protein